MAGNSRRKPSLASRLTRRALLALYRWKSWRLVETSQVPRKCVILGAPHTTNWDFVFFLGATHQLGIQPAFMGKLSLFKWPMQRFMLDMGGVPVDRSGKTQVVDQVAAEFTRRGDLALVIAPEGTRSSKGEWRSGFYHIAMAAGVPIVPAWVDNATMLGGVGPALTPSGNYAADLARLAAFYLERLPGHPRVLALVEQARALQAGSHD
ncbi:MAG: 1-acyl-sn-glycerol-3-phosphate acyltransferase [Novosphingobium sp.]|jgi:1-acyl-sn-glycerol-3-phosphate acyltransferase|nr:1-acyl-sn-glycerol-3-phosphate acyltransferase [Novosphingobium sp.]